MIYTIPLVELAMPGYLRGLSVANVRACSYFKMPWLLVRQVMQGRKAEYLGKVESAI